MSRYKAYAEYKDSGVEWFQNIPSHWTLAPMRRSLLEHKQGYYTTDEYVDEGVKLVRITDLREFGSVDFTNCPQVSDTDASLRSFELKNGDVVFARTGGAGSFGVVQGLNERAVFASYLIRFRFREEKFINGYLKFILGADSFQKAVKQNIHGGVNQNIHAEDIKNSYLAEPPLNEQEKIANFLDHETARIDILIAKQQGLIKLLKEKRQAVISHAVTKGLNPNAPMRDSGVEWLGDVPAHWEVSKFGYISMVVRGGSPRPAGDPLLFNGDYSPWVTVAEITKDDEVYLTSTESFLTKLGSEQCRVFSTGTLLISNSGATLGVPKILTIDANANDGVVGFECLSLNHEFAYFYLSTITDDLRERIKQGSGQPNLNTDIVKAISVPIPPASELKQIVEFIVRTRAQFKLLSEQATKGIELLQERRTALISAAVTGKIDVRDWQPALAPELEEATE